MNVAAWLHELGLAQYVQTFADNDVDAQTLRLLTEADLAAIGVNSVGHRRRLAAAIANLCDVPAAQAVSERARAVGPAERRQLSILYCDMVGSTALSQRLELEAYRELIRSFHDRCVCTVAQYDG